MCESIYRYIICTVILLVKGLKSLSVVEKIHIKSELFIFFSTFFCIINMKNKIEIIKKLTPMDDCFMRVLFKEKSPICNYLLQTITGIKDLDIVMWETQSDMKALYGSHSLTFDILAQDSKGVFYNIEFQNGGSKTILDRAIYHEALLISNKALKENEEFSNLRRCITIFLMPNDIFDGKKQLYEFTLAEKNNRLYESDKVSIIFINSKNKGNKELDDLMHDLLTADPEEMKTEVFKREVSKFKTTRRGVKNMCKELEEYVKESEKKVKILTYINLIEKGALNVDEAARYADMSVKELKKEAKRLGASL